MLFTRTACTIILLIGLLPAAIACRGHKGAMDESAAMIYEGTSPGVTAERVFLKIPLNERCDFIRWKLTLLQDAATKAATTFILQREYGFYVDNRTDKSMGQATIEGAWEVAKVPNLKAGSIVYQLHANSSSICLLRLDDNLLHLLNSNKDLMIGNGGQSFTLSRTTNIIPPMSIYQSLQVSAHFISGIQDTMLTFVGRSPCKAIASDLGLPADPACFKLKWSLKLYQDPVTFKPTRYQLRRVVQGLDLIEGSWTIVKGTAADPNALVYLLDPGKPGYTLYLMKGDDNVLFFLDKQRNLLVGDSLFSYTLNRQKQ
ncbi:hypothetical protein D3H65_04595 [Paraflavitalea soli]|uniref:Uncharacterized protein n=1 Tax=Paraflavitalea soli TaxID=2315862 RepID=A0A3B7MS08_9BACT|nr:hypothetical protein [Paraflavitalea soli]AXY73301.1 hypothetical protein D3H65_04595 [Paraflavitalea soli]